MGIVKSLLIFMIGFLASGIMFGLMIVISSRIKKESHRWMYPLILPAVAVIPAIIVRIFFPVPGGVLQFDHLGDGICWAVFIATVGLVSAIISRKHKIDHMTNKEILKNAAGGMFMEIPQRLMMQTFIYGLLKAFDVEGAQLLCLVINGLIWCAGILIQAMMEKGGSKFDLILELLSSFLFSLGIGFVYLRSSCILLAFFGHFCERVLSKRLMRERVIR